jgi:prephenate dehydrogenase
VRGYDREGVWKEARRARAVLGERASLAQTVKGAGIVVLAAPPEENLALLPRVARAAGADAVLTDVSGVKGPICHLSSSLGLRNFVGGHPMAGNEGSGFSASSPGLFRGRAWILTPSGADPRAVSRVARLARGVGSRVAFLDPRDHDRAVAFLSHLPQILSWSLERAAREDEVACRHLGLAGPGFQGMTRLARSRRGLWREILAQNQKEVRRALRAYARLLRSPAGYDP